VARIRTIKPEFWTDGNIVKLSPLARLFFIGMWNFTLCDHGHVADDAFRLKLQILPTDDVNAEDLLSEIMAAGRVQRISGGSGSRSFLHIKRFEDHQKIDPRWKTRCPACAQVDSLQPAETQVSLSEQQRDSPELSLGRDGMGWEKKTSSKAAVSMVEFDAFWRDYPRKVGKAAARKAFAKALKSTNPEVIRSGVEALRSEVVGKDPKFTPHPATWLNEGRWDDETPGNAQIPANSPWDPSYHRTLVDS
jgi:hypothetical protein